MFKKNVGLRLPSQVALVDPYALGMVCWEGYGSEDTVRFDRFQYAQLEPYLQGRVLEVGAGDGRITRFSARNSRITELTVLEPSVHFYSLLSKRFPPSSARQVIQGELASLSSRHDQYYDVVYSVDVMEHIKDDRGYLLDSLHRLKPGGRLILIVPAFQFLFSTLDTKIGHYRRYDRKQVKQLFQGVGATIEKMNFTNFLGFFGSLYFSKIRKVNYQDGESMRRRFLRLQKIYSKFFMPIVEYTESVFPVPFGLSLTVVATKNG